MAGCTCVRRDELEVPLRLYALRLRASLVPSPAACGSAPRSAASQRAGARSTSTTSSTVASGAGCQPASHKTTKKGVSAAGRRRFAQALMAHARKTWQERTEELDLVAPDSMVAPRAVDFVLPRLELTRAHVVVDLGCGDARWLVAASQRYASYLQCAPCRAGWCPPRGAHGGTYVVCPCLLAVVSLRASTHAACAFPSVLQERVPRRRV